MRVEEWKDIKNHEDSYEISSIGNVRSKDRLTKKGFIKGKDISIYKTDKGYSRVGLQVNNKCKSFLVHRLVAQTFIENPLDKPQVNHINGIKNDNRVENLEWATRFENMKHAYDNGLLEANKILKGYQDNHPYEKVNNKQKLMIYTLIKNGFSSKDVSDVFNINSVYASKIFSDLNNSKQNES